MKLFTTITALAASLAMTIPMAAQEASRMLITAPLPIEKNADAVASIGSGDLRLSYVKCGDKAIGCTMEAKVDGKWQRFMSSMEDNKVFVITGPARVKRPTYKSFYPAWVSGDSTTTNPFLSGAVCEAVPVNARNIDKNTIEVDYVTSGNHTVRGTWRMAGGGKSAELTLDFTPAKAGCYSLGVMALHAGLQSAVSNMLMPPMVQYQRVPEQPQMLLSVMMPQPVAMVETLAGDKPMTAFVSGDDTVFPLDWGGVDYSPMGFAIKNHANMVEATAFAPVMGMRDSQMKAGVKVTRKFVVGLTALPWNETLEHVSDHIYKVRDYRRQTDKSLTETMYSIIDLMNNEEFGGWDKGMRGFYDIEGKPTKAPTVVHSAPLAIISAAINAADEEMYITRALPTIEYTLSRNGYRWSTRTTDEGYNKDPETLRLSPIGSQFTTTYFEGLNRLLGGHNAWLRDIALPDGDLRKPRGYSAPILSWVQALYAYRLTGDDKWLRRATSTAQRDAELHIYKNSTKPMRYQAFYNSTIYAPWWDFIDLYETTGDRRYLDAARYGAGHTLAGIRSWPAVRDSLQTIHPGGKYDGNTTMWWKGSEQFRLGFPRQEGDAPEHEVEQWKVSPVGLGFEQPSTYFLRNKGKVVRPVFMSSWAPSLLRLNIHTGLDIFDTYARNAVIGRFTNYPGYYATGYTDLTMSEDFPYKGPDVSSIYYHHIPPHLAFTADYLVSEAIQRGNGNVSFPYGKQEGFVWFSNRIYGGEPGKVYDDPAVSLWLKKGLLTSSNPEVNYLTGVSDRQVWILLCNESHEVATTTISLGEELATLVKTDGASVVTGKNSRKKLQADGNTLNVEISPKGFAAVALPLNQEAAAQNASLNALRNYSSTPVLKEGYKVIDSGTTAGQIHVFRIRSPFGWDSVYGFCETPPSEGIKVSAQCRSEQASIGEYPYEWSFLKFQPSDKVSMTVNITDAEGNDKTLEIEI